MHESQTAEIVLIEDDPGDAELMLRAFRRHHLADRVRVLRDGAEALEYLFHEGVYAGQTGAENPRVILLDLKLPRVDGKEVLRRLKSEPATRLIPVVVLTSSREEQDIADTYGLGVNSYIVKPIDFEQFTRAVSQVGLYWLLLNQSPAAGGHR